MKIRPPLLLLVLGPVALMAVAQPKQAAAPGAPAYSANGGPHPDFSNGPVRESSFVSPNVAAPSLGSERSYYGAPTYDGVDYDFKPASMNNFNSAPAGGGDGLLTYNYVEAGYRYVDPRGNALDGNHGLGVALSLGLFQPFFVKASLNWGSGTGGNTVGSAVNADYDFSTIALAAGAYMPITERLHFLGELGVVYANLDADRLGLSYTDAGVFVRPALRYQAAETLELQAGVTVSSADEYDSRILDFAAYLRVFPQLDLNVGADLGDQTRTLKLGARFRW